MEYKSNNFINLNLYANLFDSINDENFLYTYFKEEKLKFKPYKQKVLNTLGSNDITFLRSTKSAELSRISKLFEESMSDLCESILIKDDCDLDIINEILLLTAANLEKVEIKLDLKDSLEQFIKNAKLSLKQGLECISQRKKESIHYNTKSFLETGLECTSQKESIRKNAIMLVDASYSLQEQQTKLETLNQKITEMNREIEDVPKNDTEENYSTLIALIENKSMLEMEISQLAKDYEINLINQEKASNALGKLLNIDNCLMTNDELINLANIYLEGSAELENDFSQKSQGNNSDKLQKNKQPINNEFNHTQKDENKIEVKEEVKSEEKVSEDQFSQKIIFEDDEEDALQSPFSSDDEYFSLSSSDDEECTNELNETSIEKKLELPPFDISKYTLPPFDISKYIPKSHPINNLGLPPYLPTICEKFDSPTFTSHLFDGTYSDIEVTWQLDENGKRYFVNPFINKGNRVYEDQVKRQVLEQKESVLEMTGVIDVSDEQEVGIEIQENYSTVEKISHALQTYKDLHPEFKPEEDSDSDWD